MLFCRSAMLFCRSTCHSLGRWSSSKRQRCHISNCCHGRISRTQKTSRGTTTSPPRRCYGHFTQFSSCGECRDIKNAFRPPQTHTSLANLFMAHPIDIAHTTLLVPSHTHHYKTPLVPSHTPSHLLRFSSHAHTKRCNLHVLQKPFVGCQTFLSVVVLSMAKK